MIIEHCFICHIPGQTFLVTSLKEISFTVKHTYFFSLKVNDKGILRVFNFSKTQPRPVAKNATPRPSVRIELTSPRNWCDALPTEPRRPLLRACHEV